MPFFVARWPNGDLSLGRAVNQDEFRDYLDNIGDPGSCRIFPYDGPVWLDFRPKLPLSRKLDQSFVDVPPTSIARDFKKLLNSQQFSDIKISVGNQTIYAHQAVLSCRCETFLSTLLAQPKTEDGAYVIQNMEYQVVMQFLHFVYVGCLDSGWLPFAQLRALLDLASELRLADLIQNCERSIAVYFQEGAPRALNDPDNHPSSANSSPHLRPNNPAEDMIANLLEGLRLAEDNKLIKLKEVCVYFLVHYFARIQVSPHFASLSEGFKKSLMDIAERASTSRALMHANETQRPATATPETMLPAEAQSYYVGDVSSMLHQGSGLTFDLLCDEGCPTAYDMRKRLTQFAFPYTYDVLKRVSGGDWVEDTDAGRLKSVKEEELKTAIIVDVENGYQEYQYKEDELSRRAEDGDNVAKQMLLLNRTDNVSQSNVTNRQASASQFVPANMQTTSGLPAFTGPMFLFASPLQMNKQTVGIPPPSMFSKPLSGNVLANPLKELLKDSPVPPELLLSAATAAFGSSDDDNEEVMKMLTDSHLVKRMLSQMTGRDSSSASDSN
eukprot:GILK01005087.1.p1 GENE.GILK01005087.1~~GILK01005087.1.p1  ORF type:complete len:554 (+),score=100.80 GILK01005087.1:80-1741(+)